jgi:hypothetical protein
VCYAYTLTGCIYTVYSPNCPPRFLPAPPTLPTPHPPRHHHYFQFADATTYDRWGTKVFSLGVWKGVYLVPVAPQTAAITHLVPTVTYTGAYPVEPLTDATAAPFQVDVTVHTQALKPTKATLTLSGEWDSNPGEWAWIMASVLIQIDAVMLTAVSCRFLHSNPNHQYPSRSPSLRVNPPSRLI